MPRDARCDPHRARVSPRRLDACVRRNKLFLGSIVSGFASVAIGRRVGGSTTRRTRVVSPSTPAMASGGQPRKQRVPFAERTLLCFVQALVGTKVVVELRDDVAIRGVLADVDDRMNLTIENAQRRTPEGVLMKLERVYVSARTVRYVHVPSVDPSDLVERKRIEGSRRAGITSDMPPSVREIHPRASARRHGVTPRRDRPRTVSRRDETSRVNPRL